MTPSSGGRSRPLLRVGFIGLGAMGLAMAHNVAAAGFPLRGFDVDQARLCMLEEWNAEPCLSSRDVAAKSNIVITMLPDSASIRNVLVGEAGVLEGASPGLIVIEMSSSSAQLVKDLEEVLSPAGVKIIDAPVSGAPQHAAARQLSIMCGGDAQVIERCLPVLRAMGTDVVRIGDLGSAKAAKMVNNMLVTLNLLSAVEVLAFAERAGLDSRNVIQMIRNGMGWSKIFDYHVDSAAGRSKAYADQHIWLIKDLGLLLEEAEAMQAGMPMASRAQQVLVEARDMAGGVENMGAVMSYFDSVTGAKPYVSDACGPGS